MDDLKVGDTIRHIEGGMLFRINDMPDHNVVTIIELDTDEEFLVPLPELEYAYKIVIRA